MKYYDTTNKQSIINWGFISIVFEQASFCKHMTNSSTGQSVSKKKENDNAGSCFFCQHHCLQLTRTKKITMTSTMIGTMVGAMTPTPSTWFFVMQMLPWQRQLGCFFVRRLGHQSGMLSSCNRWSAAPLSQLCSMDTDWFEMRRQAIYCYFFSYLAKSAANGEQHVLIVWSTRGVTTQHPVKCLMTALHIKQQAKLHSRPRKS